MGIPLETISTMFKRKIVIFAAILTVATAKDAKAFSLFNVVTFQNDACTSTSITTQNGARVGQCFTAEECTAKGGTAAGTMDSLGACRDTFAVITNTNGALGGTPVVCGQNEGQHMYLDIGPGATASATVGFTFMALAATRTWEIKVTQLECGNAMTPPDGCLQYHTGTAGQLTTFNYAGNALHLENQNYNICIRQEMGMTCTVYTVCDAIAGQGLPFSLSNIDVTGLAAAALGLSDFACTLDYIEISGSSEVCGVAPTNKYCGDVLTTDVATVATTNNPICDCTSPFRVGIRTDGALDAAGAMQEDTDMGFLQSRGVCLNYKQI